MNTSSSGQAWNALGNSGVGFFSGAFTQGFSVDGTEIPFASQPPTSPFSPTVTRKPVAPVPEPSTLLLFGAGILGLLGYTAHRKKGTLIL